MPAGPGSRSASRGAPSRAGAIVCQNALAASASSASTASLAPSAASVASSLSTAVSELSLAPSAASTATAPSPAPAEDEFWAAAEVDKVVSGIRFLTREEYKAECPNWAIEWEV